MPGETLIIFDEIQEYPEALNTFKYFKEKANDYHVADSLLGTFLAKPKSYPVSMVNLLDLYPFAFDEFLEAIDPALLEKATEPWILRKPLNGLFRQGR